LGRRHARYSRREDGASPGTSRSPRGVGAPARLNPSSPSQGFGVRRSSLEALVALYTADGGCDDGGGLEGEARPV